MASADPSTIHPDHDVLTPENWDDWTEEQRDRYLEAKDAALEAENERSKAEMAVEEKEALKTLRSVTRQTADDTAEVDLADAFDGASESIPLTVTKKLSGALEDKFDEIAEQQQSDTPRLAPVRDAVIDAICMLIVDDPEPGSDPVKWDSRAVWEAHYYDTGTEGLMEVFEVLAEPALERRERLQKFRDKQNRGQRG